VGSALWQTVLRNRRRYGGYVVHLGVVLIVLGFAGAAFKTERVRELGVGQSMNVGAYKLTYDALETAETDEKAINSVEIDVARGGTQIATLRPQLNFHFAQNQRQSEVAIRTTPAEDLYVVVSALDPDGGAAVRAFVNPLTWWIWAGAGVMLVGMTVLLTDAAPVAAPTTSRAHRPEPAVAAR
jgi:cytochrome c-type biogenesis protein CcmF